jgi:hypothetical protein
MEAPEPTNIYADRNFVLLCEIADSCADANDCAACEHEALCLKVWDSLCGRLNGYKVKTEGEILALVMSQAEKLARRDRKSRRKHRVSVLS